MDYQCESDQCCATAPATTGYATGYVDNSVNSLNIERVDNGFIVSYWKNDRALLGGNQVRLVATDVGDLTDKIFKAFEMEVKVVRI